MALLTSFTGASSVSSTTRTATCNATIPVGSLVVVTTSNNAGVSPTSVTDNRGNTYTQRASAAYTSNTITVTEFVCIITTQLVNTDVVTATWGTARASASLVVGAWDDQPSVTTLDVTAVTALANSNSPALGPTTDPPAAKALIISGYGVQGTALSYTPTSTQLAVGYASPGTASSDRAAAMSYEYVTNPGASSVAGTFGAVANWVGELIVLAVPSGGTDATVAFTEDDDTIAATAAEDVASTIAWTEDDDTIAVAAAETTTATVAWTEDDDTVAASATFTPSGSASIAFTEDDDVLVAAAAENIAATTAWTEADDAAVVAAAETISATAAWTEGDDTAALAAAENIAASAAWTEADDSAVAAASENIAATVSWTEADDALVAAATFTPGTVPDVTPGSIREIAFVNGYIAETAMTGPSIRGVTVSTGSIGETAVAGSSVRGVTATVTSIREVSV